MNESALWLTNGCEVLETGPKRLAAAGSDIVERGSVADGQIERGSQALFIEFESHARWMWMEVSIKPRTRYRVDQSGDRSTNGKVRRGIGTAAAR